jgi:CRP/FNR family cyclic AMP-dependent transcriptional regulator
MKSLLRDHNGLNMFLMRIMGSRVLEMEKRLESLVFKDSRTRIVEYLRDLATNKGQRVGYEMLVRNFLTHQEIANLTATSRQTVTTVLNELRNDNILTFNRKRLLIRDMEKLV